MVYHRRSGILNESMIHLIHWRKEVASAGKDVPLQNRTVASLPGSQSPSEPEIERELLLDPGIFHERTWVVVHSTSTDCWSAEHDMFVAVLNLPFWQGSVVWL
jgi:hypothetical protein